MSFILDRAFAERFAQDWIAAWNSHNLDAVLSHYADDFTMSSPIIRQVADEPTGRLLGKAAVAAYWAKALQLFPDLRFELKEILVGADSLVLFYQGVRSNAAEVFFFNTEGLVKEAAAHYGLPY